MILEPYQNVAIISGLEPHRSILQERLLRRFLSSTDKSIIIEGKPSDNISVREIDNVSIVSHLEDEDFMFCVQNAENLYCRSGYSTIMDLYALGIKKAIFIPTPGQREQEYLAEHLANKGFVVMNQMDV